MYARSSEFLQGGLVNKLRWMRVVGDTIFTLGALSLGWFVLGILTGRSYEARGGRGTGAPVLVDPAPRGYV